MSIAYVVLKLERGGQSAPPVLPFSKKPSLGRVKIDKKTSIDIIKLPYNKRGLNLCDIRTKIDVQRVKWLIEALNSPGLEIRI